MNGSIKYRPDIDGLRALAVVPVVAFHAGLARILPGGFTGVDIFFVISGYLITQIIFVEIRNETFAFSRFYERRAKRILPALFAVIAASMIAGWFLLVPADYDLLARSALFAIGFAPNIFFWMNTGYFDPASGSMPLLHTWSLGVEEQYYFIWPALLYGLYALTLARRKSAQFWSLLFFATASFLIVNIVATATDSKSAFFLIHARTWQFLVGGIVGISVCTFSGVITERYANWAAMAGATLIALSFTAINEGSIFPGAAAILPTLGAAFAILAGSGNTSWLTTLLSTKPLVSIGQLSYSLYLWHWPVIVFADVYSRGLSRVHPAGIAATIAIAAGLAYASHRLIERPARQYKGGPSRVAKYAATAAVLLIAMTAAINSRHGWPARVTTGSQSGHTTANVSPWKCPGQATIDALGSKRQCVLGENWNDAKERGVLWGDSHAMHYAPLIHAAAKKSGLAVILWRAGGCPPFFDNEKIKISGKPTRDARACAEHNSRMRAWLAADQSATLIALGAAWSSYPSTLKAAGQSVATSSGTQILNSGLDDLLTQLESGTRRFLLLGEMPGMAPWEYACSAERNIALLRLPCPPENEQARAAAVQKQQSLTRGALHQLSQKRPGITHLEVSERLCSAVSCPVSLDGEFLYRDHHHLRINLPSAIVEALIAKIGLETALAVTAP